MFSFSHLQTGHFPRKRMGIMRYKTFLGFAAVMILGLSAPAVGEKKQDRATLDPQVDAVIRDCAEYLKFADKLTVQAEIDFDKMHAEQVRAQK